jgi:hypothetical protein
LEEVELMKEHYDNIGDRVPADLRERLAALEQAVRAM